MLKHIEVPVWEKNITSAFNVAMQTAYGVSDRSRFEAILKETYKAIGDSKSETSKDNSVDANGIPLNIVSPSHIMLGNTLDVVAYLSAIYAFKNPIFSVSDILQALHVSDAIKAKVQKDAVNGNWALEMIKWVTNTAMYNYGPAELRLDRRQAVNSLRALCPFNTFCDADVPLERVARDGMFAGYHEQVNVAMLFRDLLAVPEQYRTTWGARLLADMNALAYLPPPSGTVGYYDPSAALQRNTAGSYKQEAAQVDWAEFYADVPQNDNTVSARLQRSANRYTRTTYYRRAMPEWLGLPPDTYPPAEAETLTSLPVFKLTFLDGHTLLAVEPVSEVHKMIPMVFAQLFASTSVGSPPSFTELLAPVQKFASKLDNGRFAALRRSLSDRGIFDPEFISADSMKDSAPNAKIPIGSKAKPDGFSIGNVYYPIPFDSNGVSALLGMLGEVDTYAARIVGNNVQMQGGRLPGNKIAAEAMREAQMAEGRFRVYAIVFQQTGLSPLKEMLRSNLMELPSALEYVDKITGSRRSLTGQELRENRFDFDMSDGLLPGSKTITPEAASALMTMVTQIPPLQALYDLRTLFALLGRTLGVEDIDKIPTPDVAQQQLQAAAQATPQAGQQAGVPNQAVQAAQQNAQAPTGALTA